MMTKWQRIQKALDSPLGIGAVVLIILFSEFLVEGVLWAWALL